MSALPDSDQTAILGFHPVHRVAQSYLGSLWIALDKRAGDAGTTVLLRRVQLPSDTPAEARACVARAAEDARTLAHPNLLRVLEVLEQDGELAIVYEHVEGEPLRSLQSWANLRGLSFPVGVSLKIIGDLLGGLAALHSAAGSFSVSPFGGLSPDSLLVTSAGDARVCDPLVSSCATLLEGVGFNTAKLGYAAPEQVHAVAPLTPSSDVFACAAMLWELLAARRLLSGSRAAIERKLLEHSLPSLASSLRSDQRVASGLIDLVGRSLSADPAKRPQSPAAFWQELQHCGHEVAPLEQVAQFVGKLSGQRFERRTAAVRSKSVAELERPIETPAGSSRNAARPAASAAPPASDPQTERTSEPPAASSTISSPTLGSELARAPAALPAAKPAQQPRPAPAGLPLMAPRAGVALAPSANVAVTAPRLEPKPSPERATAAAAPAHLGKVAPDYIEPPPIPESFPEDSDEAEPNATIREQPPEDWLDMPPAPAAPAPAQTAAVAPSTAPAVPIVPAALGRRTVAGVGLPAQFGHPALAATLPFANLTPGPFPAQHPAALAQAPAPSPAPVAPAAPLAAPRALSLAPGLAAPSSDTLHSAHDATSGAASSGMPAARSFPPGIPSLRGYEPTFSIAPEELLPRVAPSARVTRPRSGWARALGLRSGGPGRGRTWLVGGAACLALAAAVAIALLVRRPPPNPALALASVPAAQREPEPEPAAPERGEVARTAEPSTEPAAAEPSAQAAAAEPGTTEAAAAVSPDAANAALSGNLASPQLDDRQLSQLFALEQYEPWPSCPERAAAGKAARAGAKRNSARESKEALRLLKASRSELMHGNNEKAQSLLCRATGHDPSNRQAQQALAELALRFGNATQARAAIEKALARKPEDPTLLGILGDALVLAGDLPGSRRVWLRANPSPGSEEERLRLLASTYRKLGDRLLGGSSYAAACALFRRALVLSEGSYAPSIGLSESLRRLRQPRAALAWAERAANAFPNDVRVQLLLGDILYDNGQRQEARSAWKAARNAQPSNTLAAARLAKGKP